MATSEHVKKLKRISVLFAVLSEVAEHLESSDDQPALRGDIESFLRLYGADLTMIESDMRDIIFEVLVTLRDGALKDDIHALLGFLKKQGSSVD